MIIARQSTARTVMVGPVLDADGVAVTDGVVADFEGSVNGGDPAALNGSATLTHRGVGFYSLALTATDLATVGSFQVTINDVANACPMKDITVIEEAAYDALFAASAPGYVANAPVNVAQWLGTNAATPTVAGVPEVDLTHWNGTAVATPDTNGYPKVTIKSGTGTGEISLSSGGVSVRGNIKKAAAFAKLMFLMTDSTNHNPATGKTVTVTISKDGGSFASLNSADTVTEVANGLYEVDLDATDTNFNNAVLRATATACDDTLVHLFSEV